MKKKHHYIQEAFVKNFSAGEQVFVFDKTKNLVRKNNTGDVFEINNFYRLPIKKYWKSLSEEDKKNIDIDIISRFGKTLDELSEKEINEAEEWIEDYFANEVENRFLKTTNELRKNIGKVLLKETINPISERIRYVLSTCLAFYYCRTVWFRESLTKGLSSAYKQLASIELNYKGINVDESSINVSYSKEQSQMEHLGFLSRLLDDDTMIEAIFSRKWSIVINASKVPFVLSDKVLTIKLTKEILPLFGVGLKTIGAEIYCPLSSRILLVLNDPISFNSLLDGSCFLVKNEDAITEINKFMLKNCFNYCVANDGDYLIATTGAFRSYK